MIVVGLLSGTSADGIDAAAADLHIDGNTLVMEPLGERTTRLPDAVATALADALPPGHVDAGAICTLDTLLGQAFADAALEADAALCDGRAELFASHGQTLFHWVEGDRCRGTLQLGQPAWIAEATGRPVVADLRARDVAAGGHGAPLAAILDRLMLSEHRGRWAALNLGGIANVSIVVDGVLECAFDTGPGNVLIDAAAAMTSGDRYDRDGSGAARGRPHAGLLAGLLDDPYYALAAPKSTGREHFNATYLARHLEEAGSGPGRASSDLGADDLLASVTELTAVTVAAALTAASVDGVTASGGGTHNVTLMRRLAAHLPDCTVETSDRRGIPVDSKEAYLFAILGFLSVCGIPGAEPNATGAGRATVLGSLTPPHARFGEQEGRNGPLRRLRVVGAGTAPGAAT